MPTRDRLTPAVLLLVRACVVLNIVAVVATVAVLVASVVFAAPIEARIAAKYHGVVAAADVLAFVRFLLLLVLPAAWAIDRLFRTLGAMLGTVMTGEPFVAANAHRLRTIGWALLALQVIDLAMGAAVLWASSRGIETVGWQPALTGWLAVLVAFVLARVFTAGTAMSEDIEGTI